MFSFLLSIYNEALYRPLLNGFLFLTSIMPLHDLGLAIIVLTVIVRAAMFPLTHKTIKTQQKIKSIEPELKTLRENNKNKEEQARKIMELYKRHGISPFSGIITLFIQFPILIAMYQVFWYGIPFQPSEIYSFLSIPGDINTMFFGFIDMTKANIGMAALAALSQFWQAKLAVPAASPNTSGDKNIGSMMQKQMVYVFPVIIFIIAFRLPSAVSLYWTAMNIFAIVHEAIVRKKSRESDVVSNER